MAVQLYINSNLCDLFEDEAITLTSKLKDFRDVTKAYGDFSQEFSIPASGNNNLILKRFADGEIIEEIDYKSKVPAYLDIDGMQSINGFITYNKCVYRDNKMYSHVVAFTSTLLNLTEILGDDLLSDLNLSDYDHNNNPANVALGLTNGLFNGDIRYSLMTNNDIEWTLDRLNTGIDSSEFRPSIKVPALFNAINNKYLTKFNLTYVDDINSNLEYDNLYMWCGNKSDSESFGNITPLPDNSATMWYQNWDYARDGVAISGRYSVSFTWRPNDGIFGITPMSRINRIKFIFDVTPIGANSGLAYNIIIYGLNSDSSVGEQVLLFGATGPLVNYSIIIDPNSGLFNGYDNFMIVISSATGPEMLFDYTITFDSEALDLYDFGQQYGFKASNSNISTTPISDKLNLRLPKLKIIDFLKGFMSLYNCVMYADKSNRDVYLLEPYDKWRDLENIVELENEINIDTHNVTINKIPRTLNISYKKPEAINNKLLTSYRGVSYGDIKVPGGTGDAYNIKLPFENMMYTSKVGGTTPTDKYLIGLAVSNEGTFNTTNLRYEGLSGIYDIPFLQIYEPNEITACDITITKDTLPSETITSYNLFNSYSNYVQPNEPSRTLNYRQEFDYWTNEIVYGNVLYDNTYKNYMELFLNPTSRMHNYKALLSPIDLNSIELYKTIKIGDKFFTVNSYKYNSLTRATDLELVRYLRDYDTLNASVPTDTDNPEFCTLSVEPNAVPTTPANLTAYDITATNPYQFTLRWDISTSADSVIDKYDIYRNGELYTTQEDGTRDTWDIFGLELDYTANWSVQAVDANGLRSELSVPLSVTTAPYPLPVFNEPITLVSATANSLDISWLPATDGSQPTEHYEVYVDNKLYRSIYAWENLSLTINDLTPSTSYGIFILAYEKDTGNFDDSITYNFSTTA